MGTWWDLAGSGRDLMGPGGTWWDLRSRAKSSVGAPRLRPLLRGRDEAPSGRAARAGAATVRPRYGVRYTRCRNSCRSPVSLSRFILKMRIKMGYYQDHDY